MNAPANATPEPARTLFVERRGDDAARALTRLHRRLQGAGVTARLLASLEEPALHLLVIDGDPPLRPDELDGARVWRFRAAETA